MTAPVPDIPLRLVTGTAGGRTLRVEIHGELDYATAGVLVAAVDEALAEHPGLDALDLNCSGLGLCDSSGLAALLMAHRRASARSVRLRLTARSARLDRLLDLTGTLRHLTGETAAASDGDGEEVPH
ncbi:STAS domain-containing protein [Actinomadura rugatobispora]|uniref:STAS domain-containing protein n=1 Tax=Actinomadura rugatobispora TaxID=1994 RepID=A0ABW0ZY38_9ACTN|nr:hypothetical protein GCM10010200_110160 [Actinomadura rugatobispora]